MTPVSNVLRTAIYTALNGAITYNSNPVPVVSAIQEDGTPYYIVLEETTTSPDYDKHKFQTDITITIEIVDFQTRAASYKAVNDIYALMMAILLPSPFRAGFTLATGFQATNVQVIGDNEILEQFQDIIVRKNIRLRCSITENP